MIDTANFIVAVIGVMVAVITGYVAYRQGKKSLDVPEYQIADDDWVVERGYTYERLLQELVGLDYASVPGLNEATEGLPAQWAPLFEKSSATWRLVVSRAGVIVAYWSFFFPTDDIVAAAKAGKLREGLLAREDILLPAGPLNRPVLVSMLTVHPVLDGDSRILCLMYESMVETIDDLAARDVHVTEIVAVAHSKRGENIGKKLGLKEVGTADQKYPILVGKWGDGIRTSLVQRAARAKQKLKFSP